MSWTKTGSLATARREHTATLLSNGILIVIGGQDDRDDAVASTELYDSVSCNWIGSASLMTARNLHTANLLPNGKVLVVGGFDNNLDALASAELYDSAN